MKYRHIVFDIDGTLIDTEYAVLHSLQDTLRAISGKEIPVSELTFALGITGKDALEILGIKDLSRAQGLWDTYWRGYADTVGSSSKTGMPHGNRHVTDTGRISAKLLPLWYPSLF